MKYEILYDVAPDFATGGSIAWNNTGNGEFIVATKAKTKYFIKRDTKLRYWKQAGLPPAVQEQYKKNCELKENKQKEMQKRMRVYSAEGDHIVCEEELFWDGDAKYVTVTKYVENTLEKTYDLTAIDFNSFKELALQTAVMIEKLHKVGVIHSDIKSQNIVITKNTKGGKRNSFTPWLIDFDSSFPNDSGFIPDWDRIGGTDGMQSPEVLLYSSDLNAATKSTITPAIDIFTMGIVFHRWWTNKMPCVDCSDKLSVGGGVFSDLKVIIDAKFNITIGDKFGATAISLINWMFQKDPKKRPTASQVVAVLSDELDVPVEYHVGKDQKPFDTEEWRCHSLMIELLKPATLKGKDVRGFKRISIGVGDQNCKYHVILKDGTERILTADELCVEGYARKKKITVEEPWDGDVMDFISLDDIRNKGYSKIERVTQGGRKLYSIVTLSGMQFTKGKAWILGEGLAFVRKLPVEIHDRPWPEDGEMFVAEAMANNKVKTIRPVNIGGEHRYEITFHEIVDGNYRVVPNVSVKNIKLMGMIK